jgi:hypothetical protein
VKIARFAVVSATALALVAGSYGLAGAEGKGEAAPEMPAVVITGGTISNTTDINIGANAGSGVADASGGSNNIGTAGGGGVSTALAGNGGSADASANGGAVSMGSVSSGSNSGNAIIVGNTNVGSAKDGGKDGGKGDGGKDGGWDGGYAEDGGWSGDMAVVALPATGVGGVDAGLLSMIAAAGAAGAAGFGLRRR